jgi:ribonuclease HI
MPEDTVYVHADESCLGNQFQDRANPGGAGGLVEVWRDGAWERRDYWIAEGDTTNNRMAIRSAIEVLRALKRRCEVHLVSDSQYLVKGISEWLPGWKRRGWRRKTGPIENLELWQELDGALTRHAVLPRWVRGHAGHPRNEYANHLATTAAKEQSQSEGLVPSGFREWLDGERERGRFVDFQESLPPGA